MTTDLDAALDRDGLARVLRKHTDIGTGFDRKYACFCEMWPYDEADDDTEEAFLAHQADAIRAWVLGETEGTVR